jgi:hypothetical protein
VATRSTTTGDPLKSTLTILAILATLVAGCGITSSNSSGAPTPTVTYETPAPSTSSAPTSAFIASGWIKQSVSDPALRLEVPDGWDAVHLDTLERQRKELVPVVTAEIAKVLKYEIELIETGQLRAVFAGPTATGNAIASIEFIVRPGSNTLAEAVTREQTIEAALMSGQREQVDARLPIGPAVRVRVLTNPEGGVPSQGIQYFVQLDDGTVVFFVGTAPVADTGFADVMTHVAESLGQAK